MHFINFQQTSAEDLENLIRLSLEIKKAPEVYSTSLSGKSMYMLFQKTSTRTSLSFSMGMQELGGRCFLQNWNDSNFTVGEIRDEIRYVSSCTDLVMARLKHNRDIQEMAEFSFVPVINGCCDQFHPCQALADFLTIKETFGHFHIKMLYIGIRNNVLNSLAEGCIKLGITLYAFTPIINEASFIPELYKAAAGTGYFKEVPDSLTPSELSDMIQQMDVVYTDIWVDMEFFHNKNFQEMKAHRIQKMLPYQINQKLIGNASVLLLHDMPMHPGCEISRETAELHMPDILRQAQNRKHAEKGLLLTLLNE